MGSLVGSLPTNLNPLTAATLLVAVALMFGPRWFDVWRLWRRDIADNAEEREKRSDRMTVIRELISLTREIYPKLAPADQKKLLVNSLKDAAKEMRQLEPTTRVSRKAEKPESASRTTKAA